MKIFDPVINEQVPRPDFTIDQKWERYTRSEHAVWSELYARQISVLEGRAAAEFYTGLKSLDLNVGGIPNLETLNATLYELTGWTVVMVPHLVPDAIFFEHLANRRFPAGRFIRDRNHMDYLEEPDIFHDIFGHVPLLTQKVFADYMQAYGQGGMRALEHNRLDNLARLYWYTVEFGLMQSPDGLKIYGAGILSSKSECLFALESPSPNRLHFDLERVMLTKYRIDDFQQSYFVINDFNELFESTQQDFGDFYARVSQNTPVNSVFNILPSDKIYTHGTQAYALQPPNR